MNRLTKLIACLRRPPYWRGLVRGVAAGVEHEPALRLLEVRTIVDVGANRGQFALVARNLFPAARVFSFEPLGAAAARFDRLFAMDRLVELRRFALGDTTCVGKLHVSRRDDSSSLLPITPLQESVFPGTGEKRVEDVRVARLADVLVESELISPALLKIDVQGYELRVLAGAGDLLERFSYVYLEGSYRELYAGQPLADEIASYLQARRFTLRGRINESRDGTGALVQADFLFARADAP
jgi:FkbM family methyltransferase